MRLLLLAMICAAFGLAGCATTSGRDFKHRNAYTYYCVPGSAIKRRVPEGATYPEWMIWQGGSCKHH